MEDTPKPTPPDFPEEGDNFRSIGEIAKPIVDAIIRRQEGKQ